MALITLTIDNAKLDKAARGMGWTLDSPLTRIQFIKQDFIAYALAKIEASEAERDTEATRQATIRNQDRDIIT